MSKRCYAFVAMLAIALAFALAVPLAEACGDTTTLTYDDLLAAAATGRFNSIYERVQVGSIADRLAERFGTKGIPISVSTAPR